MNEDILDADGRSNILIDADVSGSMSSSIEDIQFGVVINESTGQVNIEPLNQYTKELFDCLIEEEVVNILKQYIGMGFSGYIKMLIRKRFMDYLTNGF